MIDLLDVCPMPKCRGDLRPHCVADPKQATYSHSCDIVVCLRCSEVGSIDGRYWHTAAKSDAS